MQGRRRLSSERGSSFERTAHQLRQRERFQTARERVEMPNHPALRTLYRSRVFRRRRGTPRSEQPEALAKLCHHTGPLSLRPVARTPGGSRGRLRLELESRLIADNQAPFSFRLRRVAHLPSARSHDSHATNRRRRSTGAETPRPRAPQPSSLRRIGRRVLAQLQNEVAQLWARE